MLGEVLGLPVLGAISRAWAERDVMRRRLELAAVSSVGVLLVAAFVGVALLSRAINHAAATTAGLGGPQ
jgi:hypothetical protein